MDIDVLEKVKMLPPDKQVEVKDFVEYLLGKYSHKQQIEVSITEQRRSNLGRLKGQIWMAEDFNDTPEDFKDYL